MSVKLLAKIFLILATSMLLVHNFTPHKHKGSFTSTNIIQPQQESVAFLQKVIQGFCANLGQSHLENYDAKDHGHDLLSLDFAQFLPFVIATFSFCLGLLFPSNHIFVEAHKTGFYQSFYLTITSLRGPPTLV